MPPKRGRGRGRGKRSGGTTRQTRSSSKRTKLDVSESEPDPSSDDDEKGFAKDKFMSVLRYNFDELLANPSFDHSDLIAKIDPKEFNREYYEKTGLESPLFFSCDPAELGMKIPPKSFSVDDVLELVGGDRVIEVVEVSAQSSVKMSLKEFIDYYKTERGKRTTLYNVLSLEFSLSKMRDYVHGPALVREVDWVENYWPDGLRQRYLSFTKKGYQIHPCYPKVQNYCLMSVERCYTDFHIDFGGTSVWYHVLKGKKIFWMVEPSEANIRLYEEFIKNPEQTGFFGDVVDKCSRIVLNAGDTMIIPSGWIHAVFTPVDSLVFGGNFIHTLRAGMQIDVYRSENRISITKKFRFPYLEELIFYVIAELVHKCTGRKYARPYPIKNAKLDYVGKLWIENKGHHVPITRENFSTGISELSEDIVEAAEPGAINVIAMHAENSFYGDVNLMAEDDEDNMDTPALEAQDTKPSEMEMMQQNIFYHEASVINDLHGRSSSAHRNPVGDEPPIVWYDAEVEKISARKMMELEKLCDYIRKKRLVDIAEGVTRPASLLKCLQALLERRRNVLESQGIELTASPFVEKRRKPVTPRKSAGTPKSALRRASISSQLSVEPPSESNEKDETSVDHKPSMNVNGQSHILSDHSYSTVVPVLTAETKLPSPKTEEATDENIKEEEVEENGAKVEDVKPSAEEETKVDEKPKTEEEIKKEEDKKKKRDEKERRKREKEKSKEHKHAKKPRKSFEEALASASKAKKKHDPKKDKPQYVGGLPMAPVMDDPVVPNPYNYDPKAEIMKLGTGQLKSAYRKTKQNIEPPKEKKMFKLSNEEDRLQHIDNLFQDHNPEMPGPIAITVPVSRHESRGASPPRASFMPRFNDIPPSSSYSEPVSRNNSQDEQSPRFPDQLYSPSIRVNSRASSGEGASWMRNPTPPRPRNYSFDGNHGNDSPVSRWTPPENGSSTQRPSNNSTHVPTSVDTVPRPADQQRRNSNIPGDPRSARPTVERIPVRVAIMRLADVTQQLNALNSAT